MPELPELQPVKLRKLAVKPIESPLREYRIVLPSMSLVLCAIYLTMPLMGIRHVPYEDALLYIVGMGVFWLYKERNHTFLAEEGLVAVKKGMATLYPWACIQSAGVRHGGVWSYIQAELSPDLPLPAGFLREKERRVRHTPANAACFQRHMQVDGLR